MANRTAPLTDALYDYLLSISLHEPALLKELRAQTAKLESSRMQISPEQGQFMAFLVELMGAKNTLEIGTYTGYSAMWTASALPKDGKLTACDINKEWTDIAREFWKKAGFDHKIDLHLAPALETLDALIAQGKAQTFDFAFIDADKNNYPSYYEKTLTLIRTGGVIAIDNVFLAGRVLDESDQDKNVQTMRMFNKKLFSDQRIKLSTIPIGDGLTLVRKLA